MLAVSNEYHIVCLATHKFYWRIFDSHDDVWTLVRMSILLYEVTLGQSCGSHEKLESWAMAPPNSSTTLSHIQSEVKQIIGIPMGIHVREKEALKTVSPAGKVAPGRT